MTYLDNVSRSKVPRLLSVLDHLSMLSLFSFEVRIIDGSPKAAVGLW
jgi:hypothetical protein